MLLRLLFAMLPYVFCMKYCHYTHTHTFVAKSAFSRVWSEKILPYFCIWSRTYYIFKENYIFFPVQTLTTLLTVVFCCCSFCATFVIIPLLPYYYTNIWEWLKSSDFGMYLAIDMVSTLYYILICKLLTVLKKNQYYHQQQQPHVF